MATVRKRFLNILLYTKSCNILVANKSCPKQNFCIYGSAVLFLLETRRKNKNQVYNIPIMQAIFAASVKYHELALADISNTAPEAI